MRTTIPGAPHPDLTRRSILGGVCFSCALLLVACGDGRPKGESFTEFSKADSVTETYLALRDTMLQVWNTMIYDDNRKIRTLRNLLHELNVSTPELKTELQAYEDRLDHLLEIRYDQESMSDPERVIEYDLASHKLVTEIIALTESQPQFSYNTTLQKMVDFIRLADNRVMNHRVDYDDIASRFNQFIDRNRDLLDDVHVDNVLDKRPLFRMTSE